ncbi:MAG: Asp-tRNA(Asn)/Glu-tRNA(Gln) amidotransferase subunit GatA, partial [Caulobacteraceae bacterium]
MSELTGLTLKAALDGLKSKQFSSAEITQAHVDAVAASKALNAYVLETPERALQMARAADARIAKGEAGPL